MNAPTDVILECRVHAAIAQLIEEATHVGEVERREEGRYPCFQPVTITSEDFNSDRFGISRQISRSGIGLLHRTPLEPGDVTVTMRGQSGYAVSLPLENVWCRPCGADGYISGGRFRDVAANRPCRSRNDRSNSTPFLEEILHSVRRTIDELMANFTFDSNVDRRSEARYNATLPVTATLVDDKSEPHDDGFQTVTRDISRRGIALFTHRAVDTGLLSVEIADRGGKNKLKAVIQVLRCRSIGCLYEVAGKFVAKVYLR